MPWPGLRAPGPAARGSPRRPVRSSPLSAAWALSPSGRCLARPSMPPVTSAGITAPGRGDHPATAGPRGRSPGVGAARCGVVRAAGGGHVPGPADGHRPDDRRVRRAGRARGGRRPAVPGIAPPRRAGFHGPRHRGHGAGAAHGQRALFTCDVSGQDFAKLIAAGWVPAGLALGISVGSRHDDRRLAGQARRWSGNVEVAGWTELVNQSRRDARRQLEQDVRRLGGEGVVITGVQMRVRERDCPATVGRRDHIVEVTLTGTAIARFSRQARVRPARP